jgi:hypothetical protein
MDLLPASFESVAFKCADGVHEGKQDQKHWQNLSKSRVRNQHKKDEFIGPEVLAGRDNTYLTKLPSRLRGNRSLLKVIPTDEKFRVHDRQRPQD